MNRPSGATRRATRQRVFGARQTAGVLFITWVGFFGSGVSAMEENDNVNVDGSWAYTARDKNGGMEHMAVTQAAEDDAWAEIILAHAVCISVYAVQSGLRR
jgi:hypothetical protein